MSILTCFFLRDASPTQSENILARCSPLVFLHNFPNSVSPSPDFAVLAIQHEQVHTLLARESPISPPQKLLTFLFYDMTHHRQTTLRIGLCFPTTDSLAQVNCSVSCSVSSCFLLKATLIHISWATTWKVLDFQGSILYSLPLTGLIPGLNMDPAQERSTSTGGDHLLSLKTL